MDLLENNNMDGGAPAKKKRTSTALKQKKTTETKPKTSKKSKYTKKSSKPSKTSKQSKTSKPSKKVKKPKTVKSSKPSKKSKTSKKSKSSVKKGGACSDDKVVGGAEKSKKKLPIALAKQQELLSKVKKLLGDIKMSTGLNKFITPFRTKAKEMVKDDKDYDKINSTIVKLIDEYVKKHSVEKVVKEIQSHTDSINASKTRSSKKAKNSKKPKKSKGSKKSKA